MTGSPPLTLARAIAIAEVAHAGQVDKAGLPYIGHIHRVIGHLPAEATDEHRIVAALHDVVEDCPMTLEDLAAEGLPARLVASVDAMTRRDGEPSSPYYSRVAADPVALVVKRADLADNTDPDRLAALDPATRERLEEKYRSAREALTAAGLP